MFKSKELFVADKRNIKLKKLIFGRISKEERSVVPEIKNMKYDFDVFD